MAVKGLTDRQRLESSGGSYRFQAERQFCPPQTVMIDSWQLKHSQPRTSSLLYVDRFYIIYRYSPLLGRLPALACDSTWVIAFSIARFSISTEVVYILTALMPCQGQTRVFKLQVKIPLSLPFPVTWQPVLTIIIIIVTWSFMTSTVISGRIIIIIIIIISTLVFYPQSPSTVISGRIIILLLL